MSPIVGKRLASSPGEGAVPRLGAEAHFSRAGRLPGWLASEDWGASRLMDQRGSSRQRDWAGDSWELHQLTGIASQATGVCPAARWSARHALGQIHTCNPLCHWLVRLGGQAQADNLFPGNGQAVRQTFNQGSWVVSLTRLRHLVAGRLEVVWSSREAS